MPQLPSLWWLVLALLPLPVARRWPKVLLASAGVAGVVWMSFRAGIVLDDRLQPEIEGKDVRIQGVISSIPETNDRRVRFDFHVERLVGDAKGKRIPRNIRLSWYGRTPDIRYGQRWDMTVRLKRAHSYQNPGGFDYEAYLFQRRIGGRGYVRRLPAAVLRQELVPKYALGRLRQSIGDRLYTASKTKDVTAITVALATGDRRYMQQEHWRVFRATGTSHLVAISGLHVGMIAGLMFFIGRKIWSLSRQLVHRLPAQKAAAVLALLTAVLYAGLAGFSIPTQRALAMLVVVLGSVLMQRHTRPLLVLSLSLFSVLVLDPLAVMDRGFWLSFGAVGVIAYVLIGRTGGPWWYRLGAVQIGVFVGLFPLLLLFFQNSPVLAPVVNTLVIPVFGFIIVPAALVSASLAFLPASAYLQAPLEEVNYWVWRALQLIADNLSVSWTQPVPALGLLVPTLVGVMLLLAPRAWPGRWLGLIWLSPLIFQSPERPPEGALHLTLLDVGQGLSIVARTQAHTLVYDAGPRFGPDFDTGEAVVLPYLRQVGIDRIDRLIVSHGDNDHIGGVESLLNGAIEVGDVFTSVPERLDKSRRCLGGQRWNWDGVEFHILHPPARGAEIGNDASCVLIIAAHNGRVLLPGDIEKGAELRLVAEYGRQLKADILVSPHHGSRTSSSAAFLRAVAPEWVLISAGYRNRYRHPSQTVITRYEELGIKTMQTARTGAIDIELSSSGPKFLEYRDTYHRFWHAAF